MWQPHADGASVPLLALRRLARARRAPCRVRRVPVPTIGEYFFAELLGVAPQRVDASPQPLDFVADVRPTGPLASAVLGGAGAGAGARTSSAAARAARTQPITVRVRILPSPGQKHAAEKVNLHIP